MLRLPIDDCGVTDSGKLALDYFVLQGIMWSAVAESTEGSAKVGGATALARSERYMRILRCLLELDPAPPEAKAAAPKTLLPHSILDTVKVEPV